MSCNVEGISQALCNLCRSIGNSRRVEKAGKAKPQGPPICQRAILKAREKPGCTRRRPTCAQRASLCLMTAGKDLPLCPPPTDACNLYVTLAV